MEHTKNDLTQIIEKELDFEDLFRILFNSKWLFMGITALISVIALIYSLSLPDLYKSSALLSPIKEDTTLNSSSRSLSSNLANFAGISLPTNGSSNSVQAIEKVQTLSFFEESILPNIFLPDLMAFESWNKGSNTILYDDSLYNIETQSWNALPSLQKSYKAFKKLLAVSEDKNTGFVSISIKHQSPYVAKLWTNLIVEEINHFFRVKDKAVSEAARNYLNSQMMQTNLAEIKQVIAHLLQDKTQSLMLLEASEFYVFEYIDPPAAMEVKAEPSRLLICIVGFILGIFLSGFIIFTHYFISNSRS